MAEEKKKGIIEEKKTLVIFSCITDFIKELSTIFGSKYRMLLLYARVLQKTTISNTDAIKKNIALFHNFCDKNKDKIYELDYNFSEPKIEYSKKIAVNMHTVFQIAEDQETRKTIWTYILTIFAAIDPNSKSKEILRKLQEDEKKEPSATKPDENNFIHKIMSKVESSISDNSSPKDVLNSVISSGVLSDVFDDMKTDLNTGKMDMSKILGTVQSMLSGLSTEADGDPEAKRAVDMLSGMSSMIGGGVPDLSGMLGMVSGMVGNIPQKPPSDQENT